MNVEKALKLRHAYRKAASDITNEVPKLIETKANLPPRKLEMTRIQLFETFTTIKKLDSEIEALLCEKGDVDILAEITDTRKTNEQYHEALLQLDEALTPKITGTMQTAVSASNVDAVRPRLRKLTLRRFNGDPKTWMEFWDSFEGVVHSNQQLSDRDKFEYLRDSLEGKAKHSIAGFRLTDANCKVALQMLKDRFGREEEISRVHYEGLTKLQPVFNDKDITKVRKLYDEVEFHHRALQALGKKQEQYSDVFVPMIESKLPENIRVSVLAKKNDIWNMNEMLAVLATEINIREKSKPTYAKRESQSYSRMPAERDLSTASTLLVSGEKRKCAYCYEENHSSEECGKVISPKERKEILRRYGRCYICLKRGHRARDCRNTTKCKNCQEKHHVSICGKEKESDTVSPGLHVKDGGNIAMQTAQAVISTDSGKARVRCRVLFDSGSQRSFIRSTIVELLGGKSSEKQCLVLSGFGEEEPKEKCYNIHEIEVKSLKGNSSVKMKVTEVPIISKGTRNRYIEKVQSKYKHLEGLWFSDISEREHLEIDILVGADYLWEFQTGSIIRGELAEPVAVETKLGYVLSGPLKGMQKEPINVQLCIQEEGLNEKVNRLWDLETVGIKEENPVYESLIDEISFNGERYKVKLPWKEKDVKIPSNYNIAIERLKGQIRKLKRDPEVLKEYDRIIKEQEKEGIVEKVPKEEIIKATNKIHYLPHQAVVRQHAETTKVRIVYDASAKQSKSSPSLNESLHIGPPMMPLMYDVLLRLRCYNTALIGDIQKAFLSIEVDESDRDSLRFIWFDDTSKEKLLPVIYRSNRVIFGAGPSPFLLNATIKYHVEKYREKDPDFSDKMKSSFFVDDLVTRTDSVEEAFELYQKTQNRMAEGGFQMRKWKSNEIRLEEMIEIDQKQPEALIEKSTNAESSDTKVMAERLEKVVSTSDKILGVQWDKQNDKLQIDTEKFAQDIQGTERATKRSVLSAIAKMYDPLGIISPILVDAKILLQEICKMRIGWDDELSDRLKALWFKWVESLKLAKIIEVERSLMKVRNADVKEIVIHGFSDASQKAYCGVIYLAVHTLNGCQVRLLTSKTRVTPLKEMSIPRLELTAARILAKLVETVKNAIEKTIEINRVHLWTDSMTTLFWIMNKKEWKICVANRVKEILSKTDKSSWSHISGKDNPADLGSRGLKAVELKSNELWWKGPQWLPFKEKWPEKSEMKEVEECKIEEKVVKEQVLLVNDIDAPEQRRIIDVARYSTARKAIRVVSYVVRFITNVKARISNQVKIEGRLTVSELKEAERVLIKEAQKNFKRDQNFRKIEKELQVKEDKDGILKCYGRLSNAEIPEDAKEPILLPKYHPLTELIILRAHERTLHGGVKDTLAKLRSQFWVPQARQQIRRIRKKCVTCQRFEGRSYRVPAMADLPDFRVRQSKPFSHVGVDFAGPMFVKEGKVLKKVYLCLFTCGVSRAVHLEVVDELSTSKFLLCLRRFTGRRGMPSLIVSDNAKTFVAAAKFLRKLMKDEEVQRYLEDGRVVWRFNLSRAPWWGGFFERMIGCVKRVLRKVLGNARLSLVELQTIVAEVEGTVNNRPLTYDYSEMGEDMITPSHLVYGYRFDCIPDDIKDEKDIYKRLRYIANKRKHYWKRWQREYLLDLREHHKKINKKGSTLVKEGDVVIVFEESTPRGKWKLGHVKKLIVGKDNQTRGAVIDIVTGKGRLMEIERPVQKLYPLEINCNYEEEKSKDGRIATLDRPRRRAAIDADWRRRVLDQMD